MTVPLGALSLSVERNGCGRVLLEGSGWGPERLVNHLPHTGRPPQQRVTQPKMYVHSVEVERPGIIVPFEEDRGEVFSLGQQLGEYYSSVFTCCSPFMSVILKNFKAFKNKQVLTRTKV